MIDRFVGFQIPEGRLACPTALQLGYPTTGWGAAGQILATQQLLKYDSPGSGFNYGKLYIDVTVKAINLTYPVATLLYAKGAYEYLQPPSGMAEGMLAASNFIPYEGSVRLNPGFPFQRFLARRINVLGADEDLATAGALVQGCSINVSTDAVDLRCGAPGRVSLASAIARYAPGAKDNIVNV